MPEQTIGLEEFPQVLIDAGVEKVFAPGAVLFTAGSEAEGLYIVLEGRIRVMRGTDGRAHVIHEETRGGTLGEVPVFEGGRFPATAVAASRARCVVISRDSLLHAIRTNPDIALIFLRRMAHRVRHLVDQIDSRTGLGTRQRLAALLLQRYAESGGAPFTLGGTQHEIAESLGTVRELVVRGLRQFRDDGIIDSVGRGRYTVTHADLLAAMASGDANP